MTRLVGIHQRPPDCLQIHTSGRKGAARSRRKCPRAAVGMIVSAAMQAPVEETFTWLRRARKA